MMDGCSKKVHSTNGRIVTTETGTKVWTRFLSLLSSWKNVAVVALWNGNERKAPRRVHTQYLAVVTAAAVVLVHYFLRLYEKTIGPVVPS